MKIDVRAQTVVARPPEAVFDFVLAPGTFAQVLEALGPIPGIRRVDMDGEASLVEGARRTVTMSDSSTIREEIIAHERPRRHGYRWSSPPAFPFSLLVRTAEAHWSFTADDGATRIDWVYSLFLTSPLAWLPARGVAALFRRWMQRGLDNVARSVPG